jgi:hypothetical protein
MSIPDQGENTQWKRRYGWMLLFNVILIIVFALIGHFFNR